MSTGLNELCFTIWALMILLGLWEHGHPSSETSIRLSVMAFVLPFISLHCHSLWPRTRDLRSQIIGNVGRLDQSHEWPVRTPELWSSGLRSSGLAWLARLAFPTLVYIETRVEEIARMFVSFLSITESSLRNFSSLLLSLVLFWFIFERESGKTTERPWVWRRSWGRVRAREGQEVEGCLSGHTTSKPGQRPSAWSVACTTRCSQPRNPPSTWPQRTLKRPGIILPLAIPNPVRKQRWIHDQLRRVVD